MNIGTSTIINGTGGSFPSTNNTLSAYLLGETDMVWSVTDEDGNTVTTTQIITMHDTALPDRQMKYPCPDYLCCICLMRV